MSLKPPCKRLRHKSMALVFIMGLLSVAAVLMTRSAKSDNIDMQKRTMEKIHHYFVTKGLIQLGRLKTQQPMLHELVRASNFRIGLDPDYKLHMPFDGRINRGPVFAFVNYDGAGKKRTFATAAQKAQAEPLYKKPLDVFTGDLTLNETGSAIPRSKYFQIITCKYRGRITNISCVCKAKDKDGNIVIVVSFKGWTQLLGLGKNRKKSIIKNFSYEEKMTQVFE
ncbi:hypothetical protein ACFL35_11595 [Candidatus Riflebacteria bacterium]